MEVHIRKAEIKDIESILAIVNYEIKHSTVIYDYNERSYAKQLEWFHQKSKAEMPVVVAETDQKVVGFGTYGIFRPWDGYRFSVEHSIYVDHNTQGKGVGQMLMTELINLAKKAGLHTMIAGVDSTNQSSIAFHKKFGFKQVGEFKQVGYKFERWLDLTFLQLQLKTE